MFNNQEFKNLMNSMNTEEKENVVPIEEVKVEEKEEEVKIEPPVEVKQSSSNSEPPKDGSKLSTVLLILLFVFLFAFVMLMPNINTWIEEYKANKKPANIVDNDNSEKDINKKPVTSPSPTTSPIPTQTPEPVETPLPTTTPSPSPDASITPTPDVLKELTCTLNNNTLTDYSLIETQIFKYNSNNKVISSSVEYEYTFTTINDTYNSLKNQCSDDSLKYVAHEGFTMSCNSNDKNIDIKYEFDLKDFKPIVDGTTNINASATYNQDIDTVKKSLTAKNYICE